MVIKIEKEKGIGIVGANFSTKKEYDTLLHEWRRRLREKANQIHISDDDDMEKVKRKYSTKIMDQILEEYLQRKIAIEVHQL